MAILLNMGGSCSVCVPPVSYTHLDVYKRQAVFNDNPPADYKAHSMSVNDVIITNRGGDMQAYYVDRFGFAELPDFAVQREKILDIVPEIENVDYENDLTCISFYAAECAEFPVMGEVHYDLTLPEILPERHL